MQKSQFDIIGATIVISIWLTIAIIAIKSYIRMIKLPGMSFFMSKKDLEFITDPTAVKAIAKWKKLTVRLFLIRVLTVLVYMIIALIIDQTIGFK